ncbi:hypothetical protein SI65_08179 [Aspergillus cristatus]|uniref:Uncharacterized protein n=1 Tax=Aspergillus cristatus TaxID=573508 RepID=A0A1E3B5D8_ASPCR|nr:hypothetical protein SI65_08179 [Aspergillus cristatus]
MLEIVHARHRSSPSSAVFHLTNPNPTPWSLLIPTIQDKYTVKPVDFAAWLAKLENISSPSSTEIAEKPALKLLSFYRGLQDGESAMSVALNVRPAKEASASMRSLGPVSAVADAELAGAVAVLIDRTCYIPL